MSEKPSITTELRISNLSGTASATEIVDPLADEFDEKALLTLEVSGYNSAATEPGEGCLLDIELHRTGQKNEKSGFHYTVVHASLDKAQARALRDHITAFLEFE